MMKVRILNRCEFCDGEVSMREAGRLIAIVHARCVMAAVIRRSGSVFESSLTWSNVQLHLSLTMLLSHRSNPSANIWTAAMHIRYLTEVHL